MITTDLEVPQPVAPEKETTILPPSISEEEVQLETVDVRQVLETEPTDINQHELLDIRRESPEILQDDVAATAVARMEETSTALREEQLESIEKPEVIVEVEKSPESFIRLVYSLIFFFFMFKGVHPIYLFIHFLEDIQPLPVIAGLPLSCCCFAHLDLAL